jgi:hypothetical protein
MFLRHPCARLRCARHHPLTNFSPPGSIAFCRLYEPGRCCGPERGMARFTVSLETRQEPLGSCPSSLVSLEVTITRFRCVDCGHMWRHTGCADKYVTVAIGLTRS